MLAENAEEKVDRTGCRVGLYPAWNCRHHSAHPSGHSVPGGRARDPLDRIPVGAQRAHEADVPLPQRGGAPQ